MNILKRFRYLLLIFAALTGLSSCGNSRTYKITWQDDDGTILLVDRHVKAGELPVYKGETPTKAPSFYYAYEFIGWTPKIEPATKNATYTAEYFDTMHKYTLTFLNYDSSVLEVQNDILPGATANYHGAEPTREGTNDYGYVFNGWQPALGIVTGDTTYTAQFKKVTKYPITTTLDGVVKIYYVLEGTTLAFLNDVSDAYHLLMWYTDSAMTYENHIGDTYLSDYVVRGPLTLYGATSFRPYDFISYNKPRMEWDRQMIYPALKYVITNVALMYNLPAKVYLDIAHNTSVIVGTNGKYPPNKHVVFSVINGDTNDVVPSTISYDYKGFHALEFSVKTGGIFYLVCNYVADDYNEYLFNITAEVRK